MASYNNSIVNANTNFTGEWEDVEDYTSIIINISTSSSNTTGLCTIQWTQTSDDGPPATGASITSSASFNTSTSTSNTVKSFDHRGRWVKVLFTNPNSNYNYNYSLQTLYKKTQSNNPYLSDGSYTFTFAEPFLASSFINIDFTGDYYNCVISYEDQIDSLGNILVFGSKSSSSSNPSWVYIGELQPLKSYNTNTRYACSKINLSAFKALRLLNNSGTAVPSGKFTISAITK